MGEYGKRGHFGDFQTEKERPLFCLFFSEGKTGDPLGISEAKGETLFWNFRGEKMTTPLGCYKLPLFGGEGGFGEEK